MVRDEGQLGNSSQKTSKPLVLSLPLYCGKITKATIVTCFLWDCLWGPFLFIPLGFSLHPFLSPQLDLMPHMLWGATRSHFILCVFNNYVTTLTTHVITLLLLLLYSLLQLDYNGSAYTVYIILYKLYIIVYNMFDFTCIISIDRIYLFISFIYYHKQCVFAVYVWIIYYDKQCVFICILSFFNNCVITH